MAFSKIRIDLLLRRIPFAGFPQMLLDLLIDRAFIKNARIIGAGPLIVIDTDVVGAQRSKPEYSFFMSSTDAIDTPELPTLP